MRNDHCIQMIVFNLNARAKYLSELIRNRLQKRIRNISIRARAQILGLSQLQTGSLRTVHCVRNGTCARYIRFGAIVIDVEALHCILQHRQQSLFEVHHPGQIFGLQTDLIDATIMIGESTNAQRSTTANKNGSQRVPTTHLKSARSTANANCSDFGCNVASGSALKS